MMENSTDFLSTMNQTVSEVAESTLKYMATASVFLTEEPVYSKAPYNNNNNTWHNGTSKSGKDHEEGTQIEAEFAMQLVYIVIGCVGVFGNAIVVVVILNFKSMRSRITNMFIVNQSLIDFTASLTIITSNVIDDINMVSPGLAAELFCRLWLTRLLQWGTFVSSTYNLVFLTFERYFAIVHPLKHSHSFTKKKAKILMVLAWVIGIGFNAAYMIPTAGMTDSGECLVYTFWGSPQIQQAGGIITVLIQYFIPLLLITYAYGFIAYTLHKKTGSKESSNNREDKMQRAKANVIKTLAIVNVCFILCWSWNQVFYLLYNVGFKFSFTTTFYHFTVIAVNINCCINPFIYSLKFEQFQECAKKMFCRCCLNEDKTSMNDSTASKTTMVSSVSMKEVKPNVA